MAKDKPPKRPPTLRVFRGGRDKLDTLADDFRTGRLTVRDENGIETPLTLDSIAERLQFQRGQPADPDAPTKARNFFNRLRGTATDRALRTGHPAAALLRDTSEAGPLAGEWERLKRQSSGDEVLTAFQQALTFYIGDALNHSIDMAPGVEELLMPQPHERVIERHNAQIALEKMKENPSLPDFSGLVEALEVCLQNESKPRGPHVVR